MAKLNTIGLAVIVRDEAANLPMFLQQIHGMFDQVVFVDTGSVDETLSILNHYKSETGSLLLQKKWFNDFSAVRNFSFSNLKTDLIVWLDLDDRLTPDAKSFILGLKTAKLEDLHDGYLTDYAYFYDQGTSSQLVLPRLQIVKRSAEPFWQFRVFEQLNLKDHSSIVQSRVTIEHQCLTSQKLPKENRNILILRESLRDVGDNLHDLFFLGMTLYSQHNYTEAASVLKRGLALSPTDFLLQLRLLQSLYFSEKYLEFVEAFETYPEHISVFGGFYLEKKGELKLALEYYQNSKMCHIGDSPMVGAEERFFWTKVFPVQRMIAIEQARKNAEEVRGLKMKLLHLVKT